jgi:hypothetical protein
MFYGSNVHVLFGNIAQSVYTTNNEWLHWLNKQNVLDEEDV